MLTVRWRPDEGLVDEVVGPQEARRLLGDTAPGVGASWIDVEHPEGDELDVVAAAGGIAREALAKVLASTRPGVHGGDPHRTVLVPAMRADDRGLHADVLAVMIGPAEVVTCSRAGGAGRAGLIAAIGSRLAALDRVRTGDAFAVIIDEVVDALWDVSDELDDRLVAAERTSLDDAETPHEALQSLRRDILVLHRAVGPLRRVLADLIDMRFHPLDVEHVAELRQSHDAVVELRGQIDTQLLLLNGLSQTQVVATSNRANEVMQATSSWGAILVVATLITGVYGMNFPTMPELRWEFGYPFAIALIVGSTVALYALFKSRGWL